MRWLKSGGRDAMAVDLTAMRRYARSLARDPQDADDVVQDALVRAIERHHTFQPGRDRRRWLLAIVHNVFISARRRAAAEERRDDHYAQAMMAHIDPDQDQRARLSGIARAFADLPAHHRAILHLIVIEGLSYQDAADVLDVPMGTVMSRLARARAALRRAEDGVAPETTKLRVVGGQDER